MAANFSEGGDMAALPDQSAALPEGGLERKKTYQMTNRALGLLAFLLLCGFLGVLIWKVPRLDLLAICGLTIAFAGYDLFFYHRRDDHG
jgi:hypothetical protein